MSKSIFRTNSSQTIFLFAIVLSVLLIGGCTVEAAKEEKSNEVSQTSKTITADAIKIGRRNKNYNFTEFSG